MKSITKAGLGLAAVAAIASIGALVAYAWGPTRTTYTMATPADHIVFNSITDNNKEIGDERYFLSATANTGDTSTYHWSDNTIVENGKEYLVRMYVHNNAASNLKLTAENVRATVVLPTTTASSIEVSGKISASNANPTTVWDTTTFKSKNGESFNLAYVEGTAKYYNTKDGKLRYFTLDKNNLFTSTGALLGYDQMDGKILGCSEYSGYVTFRVKAQFAETVKIEVNKEVKILGTDTWSEQVTAKSGETVRYRIHVKNTGNTTLKNVILRDILPTGLTYVNGSTTLVNTAHKDGVALSDKLTTDSGINLGDYAAGAGAYIYFNAKVNSGVSEKCGNSLLRNVIQTTAKSESGKSTGTIEDTADVLINGKVCKDNPDFEIDKMVQLDGGKEWYETVSAAAGMKVRYRIQFKNTGDATLKRVAIRDILPKGMTYVKGSTILYDATNTNGKKLDDGIVSDKGVVLGDYAKGAEATVYFYAIVNDSLKDLCVDSKLVNTVKGHYNDDDKTTKSDTADVTVPGKVCTTTPSVLPKTGVGSVMTGIIGIASLATATSYYLVSRKKLN